MPPLQAIWLFTSWAIVAAVLARDTELRVHGAARLIGAGGRRACCVGQKENTGCRFVWSTHYSAVFQAGGHWGPGAFEAALVAWSSLTELYR